MDKRLKFVAQLLDGEKMAVVCGEFGISAKPATRSSPHRANFDKKRQIINHRTRENCGGIIQQAAGL